jgi:hypothetical protein
MTAHLHPYVPPTPRLLPKVTLTREKVSCVFLQFLYLCLLSALCARALMAHFTDV